MESIADLRSDDELLLATATGDAEAFAVFYRRHVGEVLGYLARWTGSYELAADLTGEAFAGALLGCRRYRPGGAPALAWLLGIAHNKLRESARHGRIAQRARERLGIPPLALDDEGLLRVEELASAGDLALKLLERLPAAQRQAVRARVLEERPYDELAAELECSEQVVRQHVSRGLKRLRTQCPRPSPARRRNPCLPIPAVLHAHVPTLPSARRELGAAVAACPSGPGCRLAAGLACRAQTASLDQRPIVAP